MLCEKEIVELISKAIPSSSARMSKPYTSDAEVCRFGYPELLFSTDEFSEEDHFPLSDPFSLGWNIAAGAVSDIIATGGRPLYYAHALTVNEQCDRKFLLQFCKGVREVLEHYKITFIGGDVGCSPLFRCTASVIGTPMGRPIGRVGATGGDLLYCTGKAGAGNVNAAIDLFGDHFPPRLISTFGISRFHLLGNYLPVINRFASACIDTSDGLFNAVTTLSETNNLGYRVERIPLCTKGILAARALHLPDILLFFGECGEYELLFTIHPENENALLAEAQRLQCTLYRIGEMQLNVSQRIVKRKFGYLDTSGFRLRARDFTDVKHYLKAMKQWIFKTEKES